MTWYGGPPPQPPTTTVIRTAPGLLERLGARAEDRARPRFGIALAGVGVLMILTGILAWAGERLARVDPAGDPDPDRWVGVVLSLLVVVGGYTLLLRFRNGALATAGVAASTLAVPVLVGFATFDATPDDFGQFITVPVSIDAIALLSVATWLVSYLAVPVARGRVLYLAASTFFVWLYLLEKVEEGAAAYMATLPFGLFFFQLRVNVSDDSLVDDPVGPDLSTIGGISLLVGLGYYAAAVLLDRSGYHGVATPFAVAGFVVTGLGIAHLGGDLEAAGTGVLLIVVGVVMATYGATQGRRFTTWAWAFGIGLGVLLVAGDVFESSLAGFGVAAIVLGSGVIVLAHVLAEWLNEPDEMTLGPSTFTPPRRPGPPDGAWAPPGYPAPPSPPPPPAPPPPPPAGGVGRPPG